MQKKRILIIADSDLSNSGVPMVFMSIVRALKDECDFDVIISSDEDMFYKQEFLSYGGRVFFFNRETPRNKFSKFFWLVFGLRKIIKKYCDEKIDLRNYYAIHSFDEVFSSTFFLLSKKLGIKYRIVHICDARRAYKTKFNLKQYLFEHDRRRTLKLCTSIACSSDSTLKYNNYRNKGCTLYRTYNKERFPGIINCKHDNLVLVQIGTFSTRKNQLFSLEVVNLVKEKFPDVVLYFVGKEMEHGYLNQMNSYIRNNFLEKNVVYLGTNPNREELARITSYVLHPATMEGSGNVLVESQICGIHCFASNSLPDGYDLGNVNYLPLDSQLWGKTVIDFFNKHGNCRTTPINAEKFSLEYFKKTLLKMMPLEIEN